MDNQDLYLKKKLILDTLKIPNDLLVRYLGIVHGISIEVYLLSDCQIPAIAKVLPPTYHNPHLTLYLYDISKFGFTLEQWSDEASQDCYFLSGDRGVIQRDFIVKKFASNLFCTVLDMNTEDGMFNLLRWLLPPFLLVDQAAILHSAAVLNFKQEALLFLGYSGYGKTTITSLAKQHDVLGDDMNMVRLEDKKRVVVSAGGVGGAFKPTVSMTITFPIKAFFWLQQSNKNRYSILPSAKAAQYLLSSLIGWQWREMDEQLKYNLMNWVNSIISNVPFYILEFKKDKTIWDLLEQL